MYGFIGAGNLNLQQNPVDLATMKATLVCLLATQAAALVLHAPVRTVRTRAVRMDFGALAPAACHC